MTDSMIRHLTDLYGLDLALAVINLNPPTDKDAIDCAKQLLSCI